MKLGGDDLLGKVFPLYEGFMAAAYERAGYCAISIPLSAKRITQMIASGGLDGDWMRYDGYAERHDPNLIQVPQALFYIEAVLISLGNSEFDGNLNDLRGRNVAYQGGLKWIEVNLPKLGAIGTPVPGGLPIVDLLARKRFELFATHAIEASDLLSKAKDRQDVFRVTHWSYVPVYHLVHKKHADKVNALAAALRETLISGEFDEIYSQPGVTAVTPCD